MGFASGFWIRVQRRIRRREQVGVIDGVTGTGTGTGKVGFWVWVRHLCRLHLWRRRLLRPFRRRLRLRRLCIDNGHVWNHDAKRRVEEARWRSGCGSQGLYCGSPSAACSSRISPWPQTRPLLVVCTLVTRTLVQDAQRIEALTPRRRVLRGARVAAAPSHPATHGALLCTRARTMEHDASTTHRRCSALASGWTALRHGGLGAAHAVESCAAHAVHAASLRRRPEQPARCECRG